MKDRKWISLDWSKVDPKFQPLIEAFADAEAIVDDEGSQLTQMQRNFVATANTYFIEDLLRELTLNTDSIETGKHPLFIRQEKDLTDVAKAVGPNYQIARVRCSGKWMEFWFVGGTAWSDEVDSRYDECCKFYMLWELVEKAELEDYVLNHGYVGLMVTWPAGSDRPTVLFKESEE